MANSYFQFKQFTVQQDKCAMKVTTDGCLFGAIAAREISGQVDCKVLDIGTGTVLLSLMVAQENGEAMIDALEIDAMATGQAKENISVSPWRDRVSVIEADILNYEPSVLYDVIISNPPFYENQLSSPKEGRKLAHHSSDLTLQQLFQRVRNLLEKDGKFYVLLPFYRREEGIGIAKSSGLFVVNEWLVRQTPKHSYFRTIICFGEQEMKGLTTEIVIKNEQQQYTIAFKELLQPFYLHL